LAPAFKEESAEREIKAVDSEFKQSLVSDAFLLWEMLLLNSNPDGYLYGFGCGNEGTLKQAGMREALLEFHSKYYSANIMKVCMLGKESIETLEKWAIEYFGGVTNKDIVLPNMAEPWPFDEKNVG
jgi:insulysin